MSTDPSRQVAQRQASEAANRHDFRAEALRHGAQVYSAAELRRHSHSDQELFYRYAGQDYQVIFSGTRVFHHQLYDGVHGPTPLRRSPPVQTPWHG